VTYDIEINGKTRRVEVERAGAAFVVSIEGRRRTADVTVIHGVWSLVLDEGPAETGRRRSYEVAMTEQPPGSGRLTVHVGGTIVSATIGAPQARDSRARNDGAAARSMNAAPQAIMAPMPGKVVKVLVRPGDSVVARQGVVVVEAMKMENELRSPKAGIVAEINVSEGASVEAGAVLAVIQ
jgi:biotin carboxyl carrier protein